MRAAASASCAVLLVCAARVPSLAETWAWSGTGRIEGADNVFRIVQACGGALHAATGPRGAVYTSHGEGWSRPAFLPGAADVLALIEASNGSLYAGSSPNGAIFRSDDGGESWDAIFSDHANVGEVKSFAEMEDGSLYAGTGPEGTILVSRDGGGSWEEAGSIPGARFVYCLLAASGEVLYAGTDCGVFASHEEGRWRSTGGPPGVPLIFRLAEGTSGSILAGCDGQTFEYPAGTGSWLPGLRVSRFSYAVFSIVDVSGTLFASTGSDSGIHARAPGDAAWRRVAGFRYAPNVYDLLHASDGTSYAAVGGSAGSGAVYAHAPLLKVWVGTDMPNAGEPLTVEFAVRPVASRFDAYAIVTGPGGSYSCTDGTPSVLVPGIRPFLRGVPGLAVPASGVVLSLPAAPPGAWSVVAGLVPAGAPPSAHGTIPGYLDSCRIEIGAGR